MAQSTNARPLDGKVALVTGAVRRIGRATALALAEDGAAIVVNTRRSADEARAVAAEIEGMGDRAIRHRPDDPRQRRDVHALGPGLDLSWSQKIGQGAKVYSAG